MQLFATLKTWLFAVGVIVATASIILNIVLVRTYTTQFFMTMRMLTLLSEEMVRRNKRV